MEKPSTPEQVIEFVGSNFSSMRTHSETEGRLPIDRISYTLTVHDILSAFEFADDDVSNA